MVAGEFLALLTTDTLPDNLPTAEGLKIASMVADCPGAKIKPSATPLVE